MSGSTSSEIPRPQQGQGNGSQQHSRPGSVVNQALAAISLQATGRAQKTSVVNAAPLATLGLQDQSRVDNMIVPWAAEDTAVWLAIMRPV